MTGPLCCPSQWPTWISSETPRYAPPSQSHLVGRAARTQKRRRGPSLAEVFHAAGASPQLALPGFEFIEGPRLTAPELAAIAELRSGPYGLHPHEIEGFASEAHAAYRKRAVPFDWVHHEQLARALGLVVLRDPTAPCGLLIGQLIRLPPESSDRAFRWVARHECAEHLLRRERRAEHADVQALTIALAIERADVSAAIRLHGRARAVRELAKVHRRVPWWEIRARIALVDACADW